MTPGEFSHFDSAGKSRMVDVGDKPITRRTARAKGRIVMDPETLARIRDHRQAKGDVLEVARLAGIMAAKRTDELIPLCHSLAIDTVSVDFTSTDDRSIDIEATVVVQARTGVEMEALVAVSTAALTIYDMCKSADRGMVIQDICLVEKSGGQSGTWQRET